MVAILCVCVAPAGAFSRAAPVLPAAGARQCRGGVRGLRSQQGPSKGLNVLELTGALVPQGALVKGVKTGWRLAWATLMRELAPQSKDGDYARPSYGFTGADTSHLCCKPLAEACLRFGNYFTRTASRIIEEQGLGHGRAGGGAGGGGGAPPRFPGAAVICKPKLPPVWGGRTRTRTLSAPHIPAIGPAR